MKKSWTILLVLIIQIVLINLVSGAEISFTYPENVVVGTEFEVNLTLIDFSDNLYDVKLEILNGTHNIAEILDDGSWHTTREYVNEIINTSENNSSTFRLNIIKDYYGKTNITIKIRNGQMDIYGTYEINILSQKLQITQLPQTILIMKMKSLSN